MGKIDDEASWDVEGDAKPLTVTQLTPMCAGAAGRREAVMVEIPASARSVIESGRLAHLVTINRDDSPQVTCVWVGLDGNDIVVGKLAADQKVRNIRRDPRVSLSIEAEGDQYGMQHYLVVEGVARIEQGGAPAFGLAPRPRAAVHRPRHAVPADARSAGRVRDPDQPDPGARHGAVGHHASMSRSRAQAGGIGLSA